VVFHNLISGFGMTLEFPGETMRFTILPAILIFTFALLVFPDHSVGQSTSNLETPSSKQGLSHQMFQPAPRLGDKQQISEKTIEDIRRLYLEAEKEMEARNPSNTQRQKP
jgi:hypothetical protein